MDLLVIEASVPIESFPRYKYMLKIRKDLAQRYNCLMEKFDIKQYTLEEDINDNNIQIIFCKSVKSKDSFPDIKTIVPRYCETISTTIRKIDNNEFEKLIKTRSIHLPKGEVECQKKFPTQICFIGKDIKTTILSEIYNPRQKNIDNCSDRIRNSLSTDLERYALTGMREACKNLQLLLNGKPFENDGDKRERSKECEVINLTKQRSQSAVSDVSRAFSVPNGSDNNGRPRSLGVEHTKDDNKRCLNIIPRNIKETDREMIERLHEEFVGVFIRSIIPKDEKPRIDKHMVDKKLLHELRDLSRSIESCGYCFSTFQINVKTKDISDDLKEGIADVMKRHRITNHSIIFSDVRPFSTCHVGQGVKVKCEDEYRCGTLGGFAKTSSEESEQPWAILSDHVARGSIDQRLYVTNDKSEHVQIGEIFMNDMIEVEGNKPYLDIAAASLEKDIPIDSKYVTEDGDRVPGRPCSYDPAKFRGLNVHVKGSETPLGLGIITMPEQISVKSDSLDENYIIVEDRNKGNAFVQKGDSGAMVVAENPDKYGEEVQLISMVVGEQLGKEGSYTTVRLDKGLEHLKSLIDKDINMC